MTVLSGGEAEKVRRLLSRVEAVNRAGAIIIAAEILIAAEEGGILIAGNNYISRRDPDHWIYSGEEQRMIVREDDRRPILSSECSLNCI